MAAPGATEESAAAEVAAEGVLSVVLTLAVDCIDGTSGTASLRRDRHTHAEHPPKIADDGALCPSSPGGLPLCQAFSACTTPSAPAATASTRPKPAWRARAAMRSCEARAQAWCQRA